MNALARGFLIVVLTIGVLGFGAMGLCGGFFTVSLLTQLNAAALLLLSVPSLVGGFYMVWICVRQIGRTLRMPDGEGDIS